MHPRGLSLFPVRPLRLRPKTATAGGRASATPGTGPHQLAAVTPTGCGPRRTQRPTADARHETTKATAVPVASPIPGADHCLSRPEPVKGA
jgi:hypothetical protein